MRIAPMWRRPGAWAFIACTLVALVLSNQASAARGGARAKAAHHGASAKRGKAAASVKRVGLVKFKGSGAGPTQTAVVRIVHGQHCQVIPSRALEEMARKLNVHLSDDEGFAAVAKALNLSAIVTGQVSGKGAELAVRSGATGSVAEQATWTGRSPRALSVSVAKTFWRKLGRAIEEAATAAPPESGPAEPVAQGETSNGAGASSTPPEEKHPAEEPAPAAPIIEEPAPPTPVAEPKPTRAPAPTVVKRAPEPENAPERPLEALVVALSPRVVHRTLAYVGDPTMLNSTYRLGAAPVAALDVDFFPSALASRPTALANIGLTAGLAYMLPVVKSQIVGSAGTGSYTTKSLAWSVGLKYRLPAGLFLVAGVGDHSFEVDHGPDTDLPGTDYRFVRAGAGLRTYLSRSVALMLQADYLYCLALGQIHDGNYYPRATAWGIDGSAAVGVRLSRSLEVRAGGDVQRFRLNFNVTAEDAMNGGRTGGGATDLYLEGWLALAFVLDGPGHTPGS